jgi:carboxymethylenebutenolidase
MRVPAILLMATILFCSPAFSQDWAKAKLDKSPRHLEWIKIKNGNRTINTFIAYPERKDKATTVLVIHEIFGLSDWVREVADEFAANGYIAIVPDLLSGMGPKGGGTAEFGGEDNVRKAIASLPAQQITDDLNAVAKYAAGLPSANKKLAAGGFCWGGGQTFRYATNNPSLKAALVFYGPAPDEEKDLAKIKAPVYGFYGENDQRISATVPKTKELMKKANKSYEAVIYKGAGHGFMRSGEAPDASEADKKARAEAWTRVNKILGKL